MRAGISTTKVIVPNARLVCIANHSVISILYHFQPKRFVWLVGFLPPNFKFTKLKESTEEGNPVIHYILYIYNIYIYINLYNKYNIIICSNLQPTQRFPNPS